MKTFHADLHIHTPLSPCASKDMIPSLVVERACSEKLDWIAVCDHNTAGNAVAYQGAAEGWNLTVIAGIEITTMEEIHVIGLFPEVPCAQEVADCVQRTLPIADLDYFQCYGEQILLDADGGRRGCEPRALALASTFTLTQTVDLIHANRGLAIPAHVERPSFSVCSQLGDLPDDIPFDAVEFSPIGSRFIGLREKFARYGFSMIGSSDSHYLSDIGRFRTLVDAEAATFEELAAAIRGDNGRSVRYA